MAVPGDGRGHTYSSGMQGILSSSGVLNTEELCFMDTDVVIPGGFLFALSLNQKDHVLYT